MELTEYVVIKAADVEDAVSKMQKLIKRGAVDREVFNTQDLASWFSKKLPLYILIGKNGSAGYQNHACTPNVVLKRVRDVENYRVK